MSENNKKIMSNKVKLTLGLISLLAILLIAGVLTIYPVVDTNTRFQQVKDGYDNDVFYGVRKCLYKGGYANFIEDSEYQGLFLQKFDLANPIYAVVLGNDPSTGNNNKYTHYITFIHFERTGIFSFKPVRTQGGTIYNKTWEEATKILQNNNLLEKNPDSENIKVFQPTPDEELEKIGEKYCKQIEAETQQQKAKEEFQKASPAEKIKLLEADIADLQKQLLETNSQLDKEYLPKTIEDYQAQIQKIKGENGIQ